MRTRTGLTALALLIAGGLLAPGSGPGAGTAGPLASPIASPTGRSVSVAGAVRIQLNDGWFDPVYVESTNGHDLTITLVNGGTRRHAFRLDGYQVNVSLAPGTTTTVVISAPSLGDFPYYSDAPGDADMTGQLTFYI